MKKWKTYLWLITACICTLGFQACSDEEDGPDPDMTWDFYPIEIRLTLTGENGEDLLNPATPGTYAGLPIKATYGGKTYQKDAFEEGHRPYGRALPSVMYGIYSDQIDDGQHVLVFGQLKPTDEYKDEELLIDWGDGTKDVITFSSKLTWKNKEPVFNRSFKLNGELVAEDTAYPVIDVRKERVEMPEYDFAPLVFSIYLTDSKGYNLLDTSVDGHVDVDSIKAIFQGKEYYVNEDPNATESRDYLPQFSGLTLTGDDDDFTTPVFLRFGELDGARTYENEMLIMDWGKLGRDTITFHSKVEWECNEPVITRSYLLNGEEVAKDTNGPAFRIRK